MTAEHVYPAGPKAVPADLTRPSKAYRTHAWLAMGGLALFIVLYLALAAWFSWTAYRLISSGIHGDFLGFIVGVGAGFLAVFMWKALFFVQHRQQIDDIEITALEQPRLFAFINRLADEAGAPRAHRVFLSPRVNAAVFYELTALNLLYPSRKNLEIGLGLVNAISLGELKAVLAHEFGHFGQKSMAVGRWVYIAQQIAGAIIAKRDMLDAFLRKLSRFDLRIAWVGWLLSLIIWSIRSLMETMFRIVVLAQRALSREMELQADLVAVSLTGSDALIHALHRLHVADEAWERTLAFADSEVRAKRSVADLFAVQKHITNKLRQILDDPHYGDVEPLPKDNPADHRVFKTALAQPPRMWSTHPANDEREANAKKRYIPADIDQRSAWELFDDVPELKKQVTAHVLRSVEDATETPIEESIRKLDEQFGRAYFDPSYRGAYLGRSLTMHAKEPAELYGPTLREDFIQSELQAIYPAGLTDDLERLRDLEVEKQTLQGLKEGFLTAQGGIIRHRGRDLKRADLQDVIDELEEELKRARDAVLAHDRRVRSVHLACATKLGKGWDTYLKGLVSVLHYAEHSEANLRDAHGALVNVVSVVTADGRVSGKELARLLQACSEVHTALRHIYADEGKLIVLDRTLLRRLKVESWQAALGAFDLPPATENNINDWMKAIDSWCAASGSVLSSLRQAALEQLLLVESQVARFVRDNMSPNAAPEATKVPQKYPTLLPNAERPRQRKLDLWDRFHVADGIAPTLARLTVACGIIAVVLNVGTTVGHALVNVYNGLGRPVSVSIGESTVRLAPFSHAQLTLVDQDKYLVRTSTDEGRLIEQFDVEIPLGSDESVYNVAGATMLVEWTQLYGNAQEVPERMVGPVRWTTTNASFIFEEPPDQISTSSGSEGGTREVISAFGHNDPGVLFNLVQDEKQRAQIIATHARWDSSDLPNTRYWLALAARGEGFDEIVKGRLTDKPNDVLTLRAEQDYTSPEFHGLVCKRHQEMASAKPDSIDLQYVAARCIEDEAKQEEVFAQLYQKAPNHGWLAQAVGYTYAEHGRWQEALTPLETGRAYVPPMRALIAVDTLRVRRMLGASGAEQTVDLAVQSPELKYYLSLESGEGVQAGMDMAYFHLGRGSVKEAVLELSKAEEADQRLLRLAAASDGASPEIVRAALQLPTNEGIDDETIWSALALALRERQDPAPYLAALREHEIEEAKQILSFITAVRSSPNPLEAEPILDGLHMTMRGHAYSAAVVLMGDKAPQAWRQAARQLLFIPERPFFEPSPSIEVTAQADQ